TPVAVSATLLADAFPHLAELLAEITTATVETVAVAVSRAQVRLPPLAGLIGRDEAFFSVVSRDTVPDSTYRGFTFHFRPGVLDDAGKLERISQVLGVPRVAFSADDVAFKRNQLPALRVGHGTRVERIDRALAGTGLALAGNYFTGVAIEDCVTRARLEFERLQREQGSGG
ncbi:MAG TPA: protoporphyrinogen oxidase, partial [Candidatus Competibacteraceae bacterium]|nr:protoporphyrinogen oxidase [Candidatus Competibacteraceae bacterium]